jgi:hypothetical protein
MVLLVGGNPAEFLEALSWLYKRGCRCHFATYFDDACRLISCTEFDLVLSQYIRQMPSHYGTFGFLWPLGGADRIHGGFLRTRSR